MTCVTDLCADFPRNYKSLENSRQNEKLWLVNYSSWSDIHLTWKYVEMLRGPKLPQGLVGKCRLQMSQMVQSSYQDSEHISSLCDKRLPLHHRPQHAGLTLPASTGKSGADPEPLGPAMSLFFLMNKKTAVILETLLWASLYLIPVFPAGFQAPWG